VTKVRPGIARQLSEIDGYNSGRPTCMRGKEEGSEDHIEELSDEDEEKVDTQGDSSAEKEEECGMEEQRETCLDEAE
jgi:hypothetical protein